MNAKPTYFVGDVHGRLDLLELAVGHAMRDAELRGRPPVFAFLGDIVDRGPDSAGCMEKVCGLLREWPGSKLHLGNHDEWFLEAIETDGKFGDVESWVIHGGIQTIESYTPDLFGHESFARIREQYPHHVRALKEACLHSKWGGLTAAHAGVEPGMAIEAMKDSSFNWIRDRFLQYVGTDMGPVVHGHTIVGRLPVVTENRISLDTGAVHNGRLTVMAFDPERREISFFQATEEGVGPVEPKAVDRGHGTVLDRVADLFDTNRNMEIAP